jgi:hypothetical protein
LIREYGELARAIRNATDGPNPVMSRKSLKEMPLLQRSMQESPQIKIMLLRTDRPPQGAPSRKSNKRRSGR